MILIHAGQVGIVDVQVSNKILYPISHLWDTIRKKQQLNERVQILIF